MKEHTKSRRGCLCCKRRKVKCDETLPSCKNCSRRGDDCSFLRDYGPRASDHTPPPRSTGQSSAPTSSRPCLSGFDLNDIELTHQYLTQTCKTLWGRPGAQAVWQDDVFKTALKHPPLLDAILATAAMHKIVLAGNSCPELEQIALRKKTTAITGLKSLLHSVDISNYQAIFPLSCLVSYWAFSSWGLPSSLAILTETSCTGIHPTSLHKKSKNPRIAKVMELFNIIQPMNAIVQEARSWIKQGQQSELMPMPSLETLPRLTKDEDLALSALGRQLESEADFDVTALMEDSCQTTSLRLMFRVRNTRDWAELVVAWGVQLPKPLLHRLERGDVAALTVLSYWAVCLHALRGRWWAGGWAEDLVTEIADVVHGPWHELVQWPKRQLGLT